MNRRFQILTVLLLELVISTLRAGQWFRQLGQLKISVQTLIIAKGLHVPLVLLAKV
jgi:predicted amino acid racemase